MGGRTHPADDGRQAGLEGRAGRRGPKGSLEADRSSDGRKRTAVALVAPHGSVDQFMGNDIEHPQGIVEAGVDEDVRPLLVSEGPALADGLPPPGADPEGETDREQGHRERRRDGLVQLGNQ